jgi:hypothetical protein
MTPDYAVDKWLTLVHQGLLKLGPDLNSTTRLANDLREAGYVNVEERIFKVPIGIWAKNKTLKMIGLYLRTVIFEGLQAISLAAFVKGLGWSQQEMEVLLVDVRKDLFDVTKHTYFPFHVIYGQKPVG